MRRRGCHSRPSSPHVARRVHPRARPQRRGNARGGREERVADPRVVDLLPRLGRAPATRLRRAAFVVRAAKPSTGASGHLAPRTRCGGAEQRALLGRSPRRRTLRGGQPGGSGTQAGALLLGSPRADLGSRADAHHRPPCASVAACRYSPHLRDRRQHGRPGDAPAGSPPSARPRRGDLVRCQHEHGAPLPGLRTRGRRAPSPAARTPRDRRQPADRYRRLPATESARSGVRDRSERRAPADLVEHEGQGRSRPGAQQRCTLSEDPRHRSGRAGRGRRRDLEAHVGDVVFPSASVGARVDRAAAGARGQPVPAARCRGPGRRPGERRAIRSDEFRPTRQGSGRSKPARRARTTIGV